MYVFHFIEIIYLVSFILVLSKQTKTLLRVYIGNSH